MLPKTLAEIDAVEILLLNGAWTIPADVDFIRVDDSLAQEIGILFRQLPPGESARCHNPPFGLRFYRGGVMQGQCSICWGCNNIHGDFGYSFDANHSIAQQLFTLLKETSGVHPTLWF